MSRINFGLDSSMEVAKCSVALEKISFFDKWSKPESTYKLYFVDVSESLEEL